ncbi:MAG: hypothetical protein K6G71_05595, partial [Clostridiales bacterium]|nr:hypothetical protein [Clostridiales bacterium]
MVTDGKNVNQSVDAFLRKIGVSADVSSPEEITFTEWKQRLRNAFRGDYIEDDDKILEDTSLVPMRHDYRDCSFREFMLADGENRESLFRRADELPARDTLAPELMRIFEQ